MGEEDGQRDVLEVVEGRRSIAVAVRCGNGESVRKVFVGVVKSQQRRMKVTNSQWRKTEWLACRTRLEPTS